MATGASNSEAGHFLSYVYPPSGQEPPHDPPPGLRAVALIRPIPVFDESEIQDFNVPAFLRRANAEKMSRDLLAQQGIIIEGQASSTFSIRQAALQLTVLETAFSEASEYDPVRHHNQPPPALWVDKEGYKEDLKSLLEEIRRLNALLERSADLRKPENGATIAILAGKKFVESYADVMGKGAAALTIGGIATLFVSLGVDKGSVETVWNLLKPNK